MRSAIVLVWLSLAWTLLCFLFYRDRELILQASMPVWIASAAAWVIYQAVASFLPSGRWRPRGVSRTGKRAPSKSTRRGAGTGRTARPRKRS